MTAEEFDICLVAAFREAIGDRPLPADDTPIGDAGIDSLRLSNFVFAFEERCGSEIPTTAIDALLEAQTMGEVRSLLVAALVERSDD